MKRLFSLGLLALLFGLLGLNAGCKKKDDGLDSTITPVSNLFAPADNVYVKLDPPSNAVVNMEWQRAQVGDGTVVLYEVVFDKVGGDFSKPFYSQVSNTNGLDNKLTLSHGDLNKIANLAGIAAQSRGKFIWTVNASKGLNVQKGTVARTLDIERPAGFAVIPGNVYIYGAGTEYGAALSGAQVMQRTAPGIFEIYTRLGPGAVLLTDDNKGTPNNFYINGNKLLAGNTGTGPATAGVYRVVLDFNNGSATLTEVVSVALYFAPTDAVLTTLPYIGKGQWQVKRTPIVFKQESWGRDERYKFRFSLKDAAGTTTTQNWGSSNADNQRATATSPPSYFFLLPQTTGDTRWDYTFKFRTEADNAPADVTVTMQPGAPYTHSITL